MCDLPYKPGTTKEQMIFDGWSRGFKPKQTVDELAQMGFEVSLPFVAKEFERHQDEMEAYYMRND